MISHTAFDMFKLYGRGGVPKTVMMGDTADISTIAYHAWYDCIKFYDPFGKQFPEEKIYLVQYLGMAIDVGPALTAKVLKSNFEVVHCFTYRYLLLEQVNCEKELRRQFYVTV